ncbi:MAG: hypothetical protein H6669_11415, partial [Ardenticatenaceae bacterium]|nr:hypothetical protein [Ardenticatenaceae bacterium]
MKRIFALFVVLLFVGALITACGGSTAEPAAEPAADTSSEPAADTSAGDAPAAEAPAAEEVTLVIGFTTSQTGAQNVSSTRQVNGLLLWMNQVNEAGGLELSDGT